MWFFPNFLYAIAPFDFYLIVGFVEIKNLTPHLDLPIDIGLFGGNPRHPGLANIISEGEAFGL
ncbi:MAG: hypothetical protein ACRCT1_17320 [Microcoleaceae cyanobacterium]